MTAPNYSGVAYWRLTSRPVASNLPPRAEPALRYRGRQMNIMKLAIPLFVVLAWCPSQGFAVPLLGPDLASFAVLGHTTVTNVPTSTVAGNVGVSAGTALPGFNYTSGLAVADSQVTGSVHSNTALAALAQQQLTTAITNLGLLGVGTTLGVDLAGLILSPGVYTVPAGISNLTGTLTLDGGGNPNAFWLFQMTDTLITSSGSVVNVINTGAGAGLYWDVRSSATLGTTTSFEGNILALADINLLTGATIGCGRALASTGQVVLDSNTIGIGCSAATGGEGSNGFVGSSLSFELETVVDTTTGEIVSVPGTIPEPSTPVLIGLALAGLITCRTKLFSRRPIVSFPSPA